MKRMVDLVMKEITQVVEELECRNTEVLVKAIGRARRIYIAGVGRSGLVVKAFGQRLMHLGYDVHLADEITAPAVGKRDLLICCSGTGRTQITLYLARKAQAIGAKVVSITARQRSSLSKLSDVVIEIPAPLEHGSKCRKIRTQQPARSLFEQVLLIYLDAVVMSIMQKRRIPRKRIEQRHANLE
jgi:6-phospho-3-hexuloisomerase